MKEALTFDDVLLIPQKSEVSPSKVTTETWLTGKIKLEIPLLSAAMDTVTESGLAIALAEAGGLGIIHKNLPVEKQAEEVKKVKSKNLLCGASVSVGEAALERAKALVEAGADCLVVDVAHGHYYKVAETISALKKLFGKKIVLIGGNVATARATLDLIKAGADAIKVGVGPGSICTTRIIAGIGVPQLTAVMDAVKAAKKTGTPVIADGGIKFSGDIVKALAAGAATVMLGGLFAGTDEAPGEIEDVNGVKMKVYRGMGSIDAMQKGSSDRYLQSDKKNSGEMIAEGVIGYVPYKGPVKNIIYQLVGGLKQGLGYCGAKNILELRKKAEFVRISPAGLRESHPHSLQNIKQAPNYKSEFI
ncbi:MAG: guanosine monophosphate reductase [Candidatus Buchananbacteria bacterium RIFCSPLOWO2_02_FULL_46_11b]|uniref:Guanosine monophosphate reductase n=1 Tax=Candidatus Buchananbacteria bacterium RIFCSPLOWO2_02_FULL_46_11b TaxID=1797548 RepID=A0A1G1Z347_9BACT|nr:MAG: guanosine monophosphate reductase [Candidatus Buchananbacteria bacterium RIFCSPLOWO2_02_FULL_46_11b]